MPAEPIKQDDPGLEELFRRENEDVFRRENIDDTLDCTGLEELFDTESRTLQQPGMSR